MTPIRGAISAFGTTISGRLAPTEEIAAPRGTIATSDSMNSGRVTLILHTVSEDAAVANGHGAETRHAGGRTNWPFGQFEMGSIHRFVAPVTPIPPE